MASPGNAQSNTSSTKRVKVYCLEEDGKWDDRGTGLVGFDYMERSEELGLYVVDEDDHETLLVHRISTDDIYRKQEDSIISWREPEGSTELALSFQETVGCSHVWNQIGTMQRNLHFSSLNMNPELRELPDVDISNLPQILEIVTEGGSRDQMRLAGLMLKDVKFFDNLMNVFEMCEDLEKLDCLYMMFNIVKGIISLNSPQILEKILGDNLIMKLIGSLEYDPDATQSLHYRNDLREHVVFKEAIPIKNPMVLSKIHQTYRIGYLKDVILTRVVDDATAASLSSIINANKATIVTSLKDGSTFFQELFARLRSPSTSVESKSDLVHFLHEFCSLSKDLEMELKLRLFTELIDEGFFDIIAEVLQIPDKQLVLTGADILLIFLTQAPNLVRSYLVKPETPLLGLLVKGLMEDYGVKMLEFFRILLASSALSGGAQGANIMDIFCEKHVPELVDFITASCPEKPGITSEIASGRVDSLLNICELLCFCVHQDPSRTIFLLQNVTEKVLFLTRRKEKPVVAAAVRFFRTLLYILDDNVQSCVVKKNLLKPIIDVFVAGGKHDDLLMSSILGFLEHIRKAKATVLLKYVVDTFWDQLAPFEHLTSIQALKNEQCIESLGPKSNTDPVDKEDINNVKGNSDEEKLASASKTQTEEAASSATSRSERLIDNDDEDNETPEEKQTEDSVKRREKRGRDREDEQEHCKKKAKLSSTVEGNTNCPEQGGGEAKEPENSGSSEDDNKSLDEEKGQEMMES
ncbi:Serine/threonine-protein phosphatase 4 regulatory subunit-like protein [Hirschfeldia incana]|nr:Serine/threonine-protein phosphatase 4 regulatory subunit-like protein [Hirschfeldia incana]